MLLQKRDLARWGIFHQVLGGGSMRSGGLPITFENTAGIRSSAVIYVCPLRIISNLQINSL